MESSTYNFMSTVMNVSDWGKYPVVGSCHPSSGLFWFNKRWRISWAAEWLIFFVKGSVVDRIVLDKMDLQFWVHYSKHLKMVRNVLVSARLVQVCCHIRSKLLCLTEQGDVIRLWSFSGGQQIIFTVVKKTVENSEPVLCCKHVWPAEWKPAVSSVHVKVSY
jgi:hypothetical protein